MNSFNVYGQTETQIGGHTPVWLGTVRPIPRGAVCGSLAMGEIFHAGTLVKYNSEEGAVEFLGLDEINNANGYLYNDVRAKDDLITEDAIFSSAAVVMYHPEGLLIERVYPEITEEQIAQLQAKIPGVLLVRG